MKSINILLLFVIFIANLSSQSPQDSCRYLSVNYDNFGERGNLVIKNKGTYDTEWEKYDKDAPIPVAPYSGYGQLSVSFSPGEFDTTNTIPQYIYVDYPSQVDKVELCDTISGDSCIYKYTWDLTQGEIDHFDYQGYISEIDKVWVFLNPNYNITCPLKNYHTINYRVSSNDVLEYSYRYNLVEYNIVPDVVMDNKDFNSDSSGSACVELNEGETWSESVLEGINRAYSGGCMDRLDTNGDFFTVSGEILEYSGGYVSNGEFYITSDDNWQLIFTGDLIKGNAGVYSDFRVIEIY